MAELSVHEIGVRFGGLQALSDIDLTVPANRVTGLIGPNGAGKTTLFNVITGLQAPTRGDVTLDDRDITGVKPHLRARMGIARTFQRLEIVGSLTARENVLMGAEAQRRKLAAGTTAGAWADRMLERVGVAEVAGRPADSLSTGLARLVELARALATSPNVLLLDEPSSGLDRNETAALAEVLRALAADGLAVLLVEHDMGLVMEVCDAITVLDYGEVIARGAPDDVQADPAVQAAYLGTPARSPVTTSGAPGPRTPGESGPAGDGERPAGSAVTAAPDAPAASGHPAVPAALVEVSDVHASYGRIEVLHGVSLQVADGTAFALLGPNGAGKSSLLKVLSARLAPTSGSVSIDGVPVSRVGPVGLARRGICSIPEGRATFPNLTVHEHLVMYTYRGRHVRLAELEERTYKRFPRLASRRRQLAGTLSGGEQQMLAMARGLFSDPRVLLLDEISMGLAPMIVEELYETVAQLVADEKLTIIVVEQFAQAALAIADRAAIMVNGEVVRAGSADEVRDQVVGAYLG